MCWLLDATSNEIQQATINGMDKFEARNNAQVYKARDLSMAYAEYYAMTSYRYDLFF